MAAVVLCWHDRQDFPWLPRHWAFESVYKRLDEVLAAHADTIRVVHRLTPIGVAMASSDTFDPFKD